MRALLLVALALSAGCGTRGAESGAFPGAPVILISIDTLRADHLPAYGYSGVQTPAIDALRRDSILFENAYSHCPLTLPSHLSMLTGLLPAEHGVRTNLGYHFDGAAHQTLALRLRERGYATGGAVSAYVLRGSTGIDASMDFFDDSVGGGVEWTPDLSLLQRSGGETARRALAWVEGVKARPFFLFLHLYEPHFPYEPPEPFRSRYGATYDGEVAASDAVVGEFLARMKRDGIYGRAVIFLVSDHGEGLRDHGEQEHGILLYREALHVPLLLKLPGSHEAGTRVADPVALVDIVPTLAALLKLQIAKPLVGVPLIDRARRAQRTGIYSETYYPRIHFGWSDLRSLVDARHHYIEGPAPELYDVVADPRETANVLTADAAVARSLKSELGGYATGFSEPGRADPEVAEKLRALGYLSQTTRTREADARPNPRDRIRVHEGLRAATQLGRDGKDTDALASLRSLLEANPGSFEVQREVAGALARLGRYEEAAAAYEEAIRLSPGLAGSLAVPRGLVELERGRLDAAASRGRAALTEDPGRAHLLLAKVALARGDLAQAEREINLAMADGASRSAGLDDLRADVLARRGRFPEAEAVLRERIRSSPGRAQTYASLAVVVALQGRPRDEVHAILDAMVQANARRETIALGAKTLDFLGDKGGARAWRRRLK
jgi:arylsulfatase A-like enzyme/thioredoxin-like negative regulator of GroEL